MIFTEGQVHFILINLLLLQIIFLKSDVKELKRWREVNEQD